MSLSEKKNVAIGLSVETMAIAPPLCKLLLLEDPPHTSSVLSGADLTWPLDTTRADILLQ